jgi:tRNA-dihydrouridine synthase A
MVAAGSDALIVHARKAWLQGLSPRENREVPPLKYERVFRLKERLGAYPGHSERRHRTLDCMRSSISRRPDGVMLGRAAYDSPEILLGVDPEFFGEKAPVAAAGRSLRETHPLYRARACEGCHGSTTSRSISSAPSAASPARAPIAVILQPKR